MVADQALFQRIGVVGGGAWGTALALTAQRAGRDAALWVREPDARAEILTWRENTMFLPGIHLDAEISVTGDLAEIAESDALLLVVPSQFLRAMARDLSHVVASHVPIVICGKGVEADTGALLADVVAEELPENPVAVLSGPTFAGEVAKGLPTAVTIATRDAKWAFHAPDSTVGARLVSSLSTATFRPYLSDDLVGVEIGGAVKNVLAIACGIAEGRQLGSNARAALITRGLAEIARLGEALGAQRETLMGLAGLGDLTLTCSSPQSRNMSFGLALGQGQTPAEALAGKRVVVEGIANAASVCSLAHAKGVDMPICEAVNAILHQGADVDSVIRDLLDRPLKAEVSHMEGVAVAAAPTDALPDVVSADALQDAARQ
ncbi:MAG: NAD(P)H-dependent glycerol-3-phosphate dehydrogenase [Pseudomonadota bacterium]